MNKFLCVFLLSIVVVTGQVQGQVLDMQQLAREFQDHILQKVREIEDPEAQLKAIEELFRTHQITYKHQVSELYAMRAEATSNLYQIQLENVIVDDNEDPRKIATLQKALADYQTAIDSCKFYEPVNRMLRMEFLALMDEKTNPLYAEDLNYLKAHGYREDRNGMGFSLNYIRGKTDMLGIELSPVSLYTPFSRLRNADPNDGKIHTLDSWSSVGLKAFIIGYNQNLNQASSHEFTFSLFHLTAPVLFDLTKFGFTQGPQYTKASWFYRPEIGFGWNWISVGYGYNVVFSKIDRKQAETNLFLIKLSYPIVKYLDE